MHTTTTENGDTGRTEWQGESKQANPYNDQHMEWRRRNRSQDRKRRQQAVCGCREKMEEVFGESED